MNQCDKEMYLTAFGAVVMPDFIKTHHLIWEMISVHEQAHRYYLSYKALFYAYVKGL
jgi:hypothetical protein